MLALLTSVVLRSQSLSLCILPSSFTDLGKISFIKDTLWPMKTPSSIVTPSQIKVWLDILQFFLQGHFFEFQQMCRF